MPRDKEWKCPWTGCTHHDISARDLRRHWETDHDPVRAPTSEIMCFIPGCNKKFKIARSLERHLEAGHGATDALQCPYDWCKFSSTRDDNFKRHMSSQHSGPQGKKIPARIRKRAAMRTLSTADCVCKSQRVASLPGALDMNQPEILSSGSIEANTQTSKCDTPAVDVESHAASSSPGSSISDPMDIGSSDSEEVQTPRNLDTSIGVGSFSCICGHMDQSGGLLLCRGCLRYQHQQCYYPLCPGGPMQLGTEHYCLECAPWRGPGFRRETQHTLPPQGQVRCICGLSDIDGTIITCVGCRRFQHRSCCLPELRSGDLLSALDYFCIDCIGHLDPALRVDNLELLRRHQRALDQASLAPGNRPMLDSVPSLNCPREPADDGGSVPTFDRERQDSHTQLVQPHMLSFQRMACHETADWDWSGAALQMTETTMSSRYWEESVEGIRTSTIE